LNLQTDVLINTSTPLHHDYTVSFVSQISQYLSYAHSTLSALPAAKKALVAIFIGINDINDSSKYTFPYRNTTTYAELYNATITEEFAALKGLYDVGYRNFLIMGLPPLERTVSVNSSEVLDSGHSLFHQARKYQTWPRGCTAKCYNGSNIQFHRFAAFRGFPKTPSSQQNDVF
jgi:hypothetical protein